MAELIDKWDVVSKLITLENEYQFFKGSEFALDAEKLYRRICEMEIGIGKTQGTEVVRCKDCEWWMYEYDDVGLCVTDVPDIDGVQRLACDFCSYGERRTDD